MCPLKKESNFGKEKKRYRGCVTHFLPKTTNSQMGPLIVVA